MEEDSQEFENGGSRNRRQVWAWYALSLGLVCADQLTKLSAVAGLQDGPTYVLPFLALRLACNTGAAFSILQGLSGLLAVVGVVFGAYFGWLIWTLRARDRVLGIVYSLILAGAVGNVIDRIARGCVVDFVHVHYGWFNFPVFNLADSAITIGAVTWLVWLLADALSGHVRKRACAPPTVGDRP